jgi:M6 family metalloprotease-like protein
VNNPQPSVMEKIHTCACQLIARRPGLWVALVAALAWQSSLASPFSDLRLPFTQPDGAKIEVVGWGDEFYAVFETPEGFTVVFDPLLRAYCFAELAADGRLVSSGAQVQRAKPESLGLPQHLRASAEARKQEVIERWQRWEAGMEIERRWQEQKAAFRQYEAQAERAKNGNGPEPAPPGFTTLGQKLGLTLLIDFDDDPATVPQAEIINFCNGDSYTGYGNNGSVKKYYRDNSNGLLTYSNVVTIYIRIPNSLHPKSWYNNTTLDCGSQGNLLVRDAVSVMKALPNYTTEILPTFNSLTVDTQNQVAACNVFYAGGNGNVWNYGLWPHSWALYNVGAQDLSSGGKKVWRYQISNIGSSLALGTFCHENGHMLCGYPDIYDYDYDSIGGAGRFCLMNSGGSGGNPAQICAYLKRASGWATTTELTSSSSLVATVTATAGTNFNHFYRYQKPGTATEYFLAECRFPIGRDATLPATGVAIWHIDELGNHNNQSRVPNTSHANYEVTLVPADNLWHFENNSNSGDANDLYSSQNTSPGYSNEFSDGSAPNAQWWDGSPSSVRFHDFSARATTMSFVVGDSDLAPQIVSQPQSRTVIAGDATTFSAGIIGTAPLSYQWRRNQNDIAGATDSSYTILGVQFSDEGGYQLVVQNRLGGATSEVATLTVIAGLSLADAVDAPSLIWTTGGNGIWAGEVDRTHDGIDAARSGLITHNQQSWLQTAVIGPGSLSFWWKVSSEASYDFLSLYVDGALQAGRISGEIDWQQKTFTIAPGSHVLQWRYTKDVSVNTGQDCAWIDQVSFLQDTPPPATLLAPRYLASGQFQCDVSGSVGGTYIILGSSNFIDWISLETNTAPFTFTDPAANQVPFRVYRARSGH